MNEAFGIGHNGRVDDRTDNPCRRYDCHACCLETRMTLTEADVARLQDRGWSDFVRLHRNGDLELINVDGACIFLDDGSCRVYEARPEGCRFYPFVFDLRDKRVVRDGGCPHRDEFTLDAELATALRRSVAREEAEARGRGEANG